MDRNNVEEQEESHDIFMWIFSVWLSLEKFNHEKGLEPRPLWCFCNAGRYAYDYTLKIRFNAQRIRTAWLADNL